MIPLFLHFSGLPISETGAIRGLVDRVQRELRSRGGTVLSTNSDAKGSYISGAFGAPVAHEDDAERALDAAAALAGAAAGLTGAEVRIGLDRGAALVGVMGIATRPRYDVIGATMNRAASMMMCAAPGEAVLTPELAKSQSGRFRTHPVVGLRPRRWCPPAGRAFRRCRARGESPGAGTAGEGCRSGPDPGGPATS